MLLNEINLVVKILKGILNNFIMLYVVFKYGCYSLHYEGGRISPPLLPLIATHHITVSNYSAYNVPLLQIPIKKGYTFSITLV